MNKKLSCAAPILALIAGSAIAEPSLERGEYLVHGPAGCGNCHTPMNEQGGFISEMELAGRLVLEEPEFTAIAPNITPAGRIGDWSDAEAIKAIREGIRPDGSLIGPPMPITMYRGLSDDDVASIVMFLRTLPPVENEVPASTYNIPLPPNYGPPVESVAAVPEGVTVEYGEYLAGPVAHCMECHTPLGPQGNLIMERWGAGGFEFPGPWGVSVAANITSHPEDGIVEWTDEELFDMITKGVRPGNERMMPPMPYSFFANMKKNDVDAIILYLRTLPPVPGP